MQWQLEPAPAQEGSEAVPELPEQIWHAVMEALSCKDLAAVACACPRLYLLAASVGTRDGKEVTHACCLRAPHATMFVI